MNTTNFFVELIVIGLHTMIGLCSFVLAFTGLPNIDIEKFLTIYLAILIIGMAYVVGIIMDRFADDVFDKKDKEIRKEKIPKEITEPLLTVRFFILVNSEPVYEQLEYARIRLRISRSAVPNFFR